MSLVATASEYLTAMEALEQAGIGIKTFTNVADWSLVTDALSKAGYVEIVSDTGISLGWTKLFSSTVAQTASSTAGTTLSTIGSVDVAFNAATSTATVTEAGLASSAGSSASGLAGAGFSGAAYALVAVAAACGVTLAIDVARDLISDDFSWASDSVGGSFLTWLTGTGDSYMDEDTINRIKDFLASKGIFDDSIRNANFTHTDFEEVPVFSLEQAAYNAYNNMKWSDYQNWEADGFTEEQFEHYRQDALNKALSEIENYFSDYKGIGEVDLGIIRVYTFGYSYASLADVRASKSTKARGSFNSQIGGSFTVYKDDYFECINSPFGYPVWTRRGVTGYLDIKVDGFSEGDDQCNIGIINEHAGIKKPGAVLPVPNVPVSTTYPNWDANKKYVSVPDENDPNRKKKVLPITIPHNDEEARNNSQDDSQSGENTDPSIDDQLQGQEDLAFENDIPTDTTPEEQIGETPIIIPPTSGSGTGMVAIYNPTQSQLASLSQWLWSRNFFDNIVKLFQDPMQAIIGLNLLYATPTRGADENIQVGTLDSGVLSRTVSDTNIHIDCGSVKVNRYYNNVLDFINTKIDCYLPFIGIVSLSTADVMDRTVSIKYDIDVLTGCCIARIIVDNQMLYTYSGNCAVQLPISSANYSSMISSMIGLVGAGFATLATGGVGAGIAAGAVASGAVGFTASHAGNLASSIGNAVERSGNLGSNAGALNNKKPYLIILRNKKYEPANYNKYYGYPSRKTMKLEVGSGYTIVESVILNNIDATENELDELNTLLKGGIIL